MPGNYVAPDEGKDAFNCPHCGAFAHQAWGQLASRDILDDWRVAHCQRCDDISIWFVDSMIYPSVGTAPHPNRDLPPDIADDYEEARAIMNRSPRGAAALLRLAIQKLCKHLGESGKDINADIAALVQKGLPQSVQKALDTVRVVGNEAVHPGTLDLKDDAGIAGALFKLVNIVAEKMISEPREVDEIYATLPPAKLDGIAKRDRGKASASS